MGFGIIDKQEGQHGKVLSTIEVDKLAPLQRPDGTLVRAESRYGSHNSKWIVMVDLPKRYAVLNKIGCG